MSKQKGGTLRPPIIQDEMQKRRMLKKATTVPKFQTRAFVLYKDELVYKSKDGKHVRGGVSILGIKICEDVDESSFHRPHVFQVGYLEKGKMFHLYIQAKDDDMRDRWKIQIRKLCSTYNDQRMQQQYHPGHFKFKSLTWSCCLNPSKENIGCNRAYRYDDPEPLGGALSTCSVEYRNPHKTPVPHRQELKTRVKMPSECYDSDELDDSISSPSTAGTDSILDDSLERKYLAGRGANKRYSLPCLQEPPSTTPPSTTPLTYRLEHKQYNRGFSEGPRYMSGSKTLGRHTARHSIHDYSTAYFGKSDDTYLVIHKRGQSSDGAEKRPISTVVEDPLDKGQLSSSSMRYTSNRYSGIPIPRDHDDEDLGIISQSTPYYCPINTGGVTDSRLFSISSTGATAGSERYDSLEGHSSRLDSILSQIEMTRLDSQGSTIESSNCESIPRTESDYQSRIDESDCGGSGMVYAHCNITDQSLGEFTAGSVELDLTEYSGENTITSGTFGREMFGQLSAEERSQSGTYVNTHGFT